jgi:hypothetical protein
VVGAGGGIISYIPCVVNENLALDPVPSPLDIQKEAGIAVES